MSNRLFIFLRFNCRSRLAWIAPVAMVFVVLGVAASPQDRPPERIIAHGTDVAPALEASEDVQPAPFTPSHQAVELLHDVISEPPAAPVEGARTVRMLVTAYCGCPKCCGPKACGLTASGLPITYHGGMFVAADKAVLPFGARVSIPGYHNGHPVEVIDRGGAITGNHLDVFFPRHEQAVQWGRRWIRVTVFP